MYDDDILRDPEDIDDFWLLVSNHFAFIQDVRALLAEEDVRIKTMRSAQSPDEVLAAMGKAPHKDDD